MSSRLGAIPASPKRARRAAHEGKVRKEFWLDPRVLAEAQAALGAATERETVELALDLVASQGELVAGARTARAHQALERDVLDAYVRRGRVLAPSAASWDALGTALAVLGAREELDVRQVPRRFVFDVLIAHTCREAGAVLVSANARDMARIARVFAFEHVAPYPGAP